MLVVIVTAALVVAGCGSSSSSDSTALSKAAFIKKADAICAKTDGVQAAKFRTYAASHKQLLGTRAGMEQVIRIVGIRPVFTEVKEIAALPAPEGDEERIASILQGIEEATKKAEKEPSSTERYNGNPYLGVKKMAREYGFKACAEPL